MQIMSIPAFDDNYIWLLHTKGYSGCIVVDPGDAKVVQQRLIDLDLELEAILLTHHHYDHIDGVEALCIAFPKCQVYASQGMAASFPFTPLTDGDHIKIPGIEASFEVIALPGHTLTHLGYFNNQQLFCGDTLFNCGCGRLFEGTPQQMSSSFERLAKLPDSTMIYCAHEYTIANLQFAVAVEPNNADLLTYLKLMTKARQQGLATVPMDMASQKRCNPFLRTKHATVKASVENYCQRPCEDQHLVFAGLRHWKDNF